VVVREPSRAGVEVLVFVETACLLPQFLAVLLDDLVSGADGVTAAARPVLRFEDDDVVAAVAFLQRG
jgi:hypothetical protein